MPDNTFLHIRRRDSSPTRVLELADSSVRIGRGADCEVQLGGEATAEVHCLLHRQGDDWQVEPSAEVLVDGRPVEGARPIAPGEVLRVGDHWLSIQPSDRPAPADRGSFESPIPVASIEVEVEVEVEAPRAEPPPAASPRDAGPGFGAAEERLARWQASEQRRERWLKDREQEKGWESRWRAAGDALRARSAGSSPPKPATPYRRPDPKPDRPIRPAERPTAPPPSPIRPDYPTSAAPRPAPSFVRPEPVADPPVTLRFPAPPAPVLRVVGPPDSVGAEDERINRLADEVFGEPETFDRPEEAAEIVADRADFAAIAEEPSPAFEAEITEESEPAAPVEIAAETMTPPVSAAKVEEPEPAESFAAGVEVPAEPMAAEEAEEIAPEPPIEFPEVARDLSAWPSVQSILASRAPTTCGPQTIGRVATERSSKPSKSSKRGATEVPTEARAPRAWTVPIWLALPISAMTCLTLGGGGTALAWTWARDAQVAGSIGDRILKGGDLPAAGELPEVGAAGGSWWGSTAGNLYLLAIAADRSETDPDREERARFFLRSARRASPLRADVRLALARSPGRDGEPKTLSDSGLSRDVVSLAWAGHERLVAGNPQGAKDAYFASLDMAARAEPPDVAPSMDEAEEVRRFRIAGEEALEPVLADMADGPDWTYSQWASALPPTAAVKLAAYRVLKARENPEAAKLLEEAASGPEPPPGYPRAIHLAARAEALAIQGRWNDAEPLYREAIAARKPGAIRRSWWSNLADLDGRIGDDARRREAWDAAVLGAGAGDEIGRQVARSRGRAGLGSRAEAPAAADRGAASKSAAR